MRTRGMVTVLVMLFLIATVIFALSQMLGVSGGNVIDGQRQGDSGAAFFLAESGLDKAQAGLSSALNATYTNASCTGVGSSYSLGRGSVTLSAVSAPASCNNSSVTPCTACTVSSTGSVGASTRELTQEMKLTVKNGTACNAATSSCTNSPTVTWQLKLKNLSGNAAVGIFNLTYDGQGNNAATCAVASGCKLQLDVDSPSAGQRSVAIMGNAVLIPANSTYPIYQTMTRNNDVVEVGALFQGMTAPTLTGPYTASVPDLGGASYWERRNNQTARTVGQSGSLIGATNDGTATASGSCAAPSGNVQTCTNWCYGGDTLVYSFSASVAQLSDQLSSVTFGTNGGSGQNIAMTRVAKYPSVLVTGAPTTIDAEIWYARNPNFTGSTPLAVNASSYKGRGTGAVGAAWTTTSNSDTSITATTLTIGSAIAGGFGTWPAQIISVGDTVTSTGVAANTTIVQQLSSFETGGLATGRGGRGTYEVNISQTVNGANNRAWTVNSNVLNVTACAICFFDQSDAVALAGLSAGRTINAAQTTPATTYGRTEVAGGLGRYPISGAATRVASGTTLYAGTPGTTLYLPSASSQPTVTTPAMLITVKSGTGAMAPGTTVTAVSAPNAATTAFTVSTAPTTALDGASLCAGTCAFFVPGTTTAFAFNSGTSTINRWASGFTCLKGVDQTPQVVTSTSAVTSRWQEPVK